MKDKEFWLTAVAAISAAAFALIVAYGLLTQEQADLWLQLILAVAAVVVPIVIGQTAQTFVKSRSAVKMTAIENDQAGLLEQL